LALQRLGDATTESGSLTPKDPRTRHPPEQLYSYRPAVLHNNTTRDTKFNHLWMAPPAPLPNQQLRAQNLGSVIPLLSQTSRAHGNVSNILPSHLVPRLSPTLLTHCKFGPILKPLDVCGEVHWSFVLPTAFDLQPRFQLVSYSAPHARRDPCRRADRGGFPPPKSYGSFRSYLHALRVHVPVGDTNGWPLMSIRSAPTVLEGAALGTVCPSPRPYRQCFSLVSFAGVSGHQHRPLG
jgi:hypothetical protein